MEITRIFKILEIPPALITVPTNLYGTTIRELQNTMRGTAKKNFRRLCMVCHPDRGGDADKMKELIEAYGLAREMILIEPPSHTGVSISLGSAGLNTNTGQPYWGWKKRPPGSNGDRGRHQPGGL